MLYRINLPDCTKHLNWIVRLQGDLLHALCDSHLHPADITTQWMEKQRPDIDKSWIGLFCTWIKDKRSILTRMQDIAALSSEDKNAIIEHYEANISCAKAFDESAPPPPKTTPLNKGTLSNKAAEAYNDFFKFFYDPTFYKESKGYPIGPADYKGEGFHKNKYLKAYQDANSDLKACPLCDGNMDGAELDHWLAKKHFPELNCDPRNLVEICGACNGSSNKGQKLALDPGVEDPFARWFHPHLRPACGKYALRVESGRPTLYSNDPASQKRLNKLDRLINLHNRWKNEYRNQLKGLQSRIRGRRRRGRKFDRLLLEEQLESWKLDAEEEKGIRNHKLLEICLLSAALERGSTIYDELCAYAFDDS